jgi:hypothetical protein
MEYKNFGGSWSPFSGGVTGSSDSSLTIAGSDAIINLGHTNIWSAPQQFGAGINDVNSALSISSESRQLVDQSGAVVMDWNYSMFATSLFLRDHNEVNSVSWDNRLLFDSNGYGSLFWGLRQLKDTSGNTVLEWGGAAIDTTLD